MVNTGTGHRPILTVPQPEADFVVLAQLKGCQLPAQASSAARAVRFAATSNLDGAQPDARSLQPLYGVGPVGGELPDPLIEGGGSLLGPIDVVEQLAQVHRMMLREWPPSARMSPGSASRLLSSPGLERRSTSLRAEATRAHPTASRPDRAAAPVHGCSSST